MTIIDPDFLKSCHSAGPCEYCGVMCRERECHHVIPRGAGGANRLDIPLNAVRLGATRPYPLCLCHRSVTDGNISQAEMFDVVAAREGVLVDDVEAVLRLILRLDKQASPYKVFVAADQLETVSARRLYLDTMRKAGKL